MHEICRDDWPDLQGSVFRDREFQGPRERPFAWEAWKKGEGWTLLPDGLEVWLDGLDLAAWGKPGVGRIRRGDADDYFHGRAK